MYSIYAYRLAFMAYALPVTGHSLMQRSYRFGITEDDFDTVPQQLANSIAPSPAEEEDEETESEKDTDAELVRRPRQRHRVWARVGSSSGTAAGDQYQWSG